MIVACHYSESPETESVSMFPKAVTTGKLEDVLKAFSSTQVDIAAIVHEIGVVDDDAPIRTCHVVLSDETATSIVLKCQYEHVDSFPETCVNQSVLISHAQVHVADGQHILRTCLRTLVTVNPDYTACHALTDFWTAMAEPAPTTTETAPDGGSQ